MKKLFITLLVTGLISYLFGNYIFTTYKKNLENVVKRVSSTYETVYMLQYGSYKNREKALDNDLEVSYILEKEDETTSFLTLFITTYSLECISTLIPLNLTNFFIFLNSLLNLYILFLSIFGWSIKGIKLDVIL